MNVLALLLLVLKKGAHFVFSFCHNVISIVQWLVLNSLSIALELTHLNRMVWGIVFSTVQWLLLKTLSIALELVQAAMQLMQTGMHLSFRLLRRVLLFLKPAVVKAEHFTLYLCHCTFMVCNVLGSMLAACALFAFQVALVNVLFSFAFFSSPLDTTTALLSDFAEISQGTLFIGLEKVDWGTMDWPSLFQEWSDTRDHWIRFAARCANGVYELVLVERDFDRSPFKPYLPYEWFAAEEEERRVFSALFSDPSVEEVAMEPTAQKARKLDKEGKTVLLVSLFFVASVLARVCA